MNIYRYGGDRYTETRYERILELVDVYCNPHNKVIADLDAGSNPVSQYIPGNKSITLDFDPDSNPDIVCDLNTGIPLQKNVCDIVIATEVIEHIYYSKKLYGEILRILKPGGHLRDYNFSEFEHILKDSGFQIVKSKTNGLIYNRFCVPYYLLPRTFGQKIIFVA